MIIQNNTITIKAQLVPLDRILQELADKTAISIVTYEPLNDTVGVNLENMPLEKALKWILRDYNNVFMYAPQKKGEPRISKIIIFSRSSKRPGESQDLARNDAGRGNSGSPREFEKTQQSSQAATDNAHDSRNGPLIAQISKGLAKGKRDDSRLKAVHDLSSLNDEMAFVPLIQALYDENPKVSQQAMDALSKMGGNNVERALKGFLSDRDPRVRKISEEALKKVRRN